MSETGIDFVCTECKKTFWIPSADYEGQFDHPPSEPICPDCEERLECEHCGGTGLVTLYGVMVGGVVGDADEQPCPHCGGINP